MGEFGRCALDRSTVARKCNNWHWRLVEVPDIDVPVVPTRSQGAPAERVEGSLNEQDAGQRNVLPRAL